MQMEIANSYKRKLKEKRKHKVVKIKYMEMESTKDSALPQPNFKVAKSYFTNLATILSHTI